MSFANRNRMSYEEAVEISSRPTNVITHLLRNEDDGSYSVMSHIVCEYCDYCDEQGDCRGVLHPTPCIAKENPY